MLRNLSEELDRLSGSCAALRHARCQAPRHTATAARAMGYPCISPCSTPYGMVFRGCCAPQFCKVYEGIATFPRLRTAHLQCKTTSNLAETGRSAIRKHWKLSCSGPTVAYNMGVGRHLFCVTWHSQPVGQSCSEAPNFDPIF